MSPRPVRHLQEIAQPSNSSANGLFNSPYQYQIHTFQRGYFWTLEKQAVALWADIQGHSTARLGSARVADDVARSPDSEWFGYSDPAMKEALYDIAPLRRFAGLSRARGTVPDETTILNFRRLLETHQLAPKILTTINKYLADKGLLVREGTIVDATIIHVPSSTKDTDEARDPEMHQMRKGQQWYSGNHSRFGGHTHPAMAWSR